MAPNELLPNASSPGTLLEVGMLSTCVAQLLRHSCAQTQAQMLDVAASLVYYMYLSMREHPSLSAHSYLGTSAQHLVSKSKQDEWGKSLPDCSRIAHGVNSITSTVLL
jgi:hypothetical protein